MVKDFEKLYMKNQVGPEVLFTGMGLKWVPQTVSMTIKDRIE